MNNTVKAFDDHAADYDQWFDCPEGKALFLSEVEAVSLLTKGLEHPFLEIGVGTGRFAKELGVGYGIDPSVKMLTLAATRGIKTKQAEGEAVPFPDGFFGAVFIIFTLCFVKAPEKVIAEAKRVLKRGGGLIIGFINSKSPWGGLYMQKRDAGHPLYGLARFYDPEEVTEMLTAAGFTVEAYSSTLCRPPSVQPAHEEAHIGPIKEAGVICIRAKKATSGDRL
ncbi:MAG: class I SAM-dependent methyltransferase [Thermodesulfovibrionales bacterium]